MLDWLDKLSLKDIIGLIKNLFQYFLSKWYWLILAIALGAGFGYWKVYKIKPTYTASITFVLNTETTGGGGGARFSVLASQFGLDAGGGGSESVFSGDNIFELFKTRKIAEKALVAPVPELNGCLLSYMHKLQPDTPNYNLGSISANPEQLTVAQTAALRKHTGILSKSINVFKKDKKLSYYTITATGSDEIFTYYAAKTMLNETSEYFINTKLKVAKKNLELLMKEGDSLYALLGGTIAKTASIADETYNLNPSMIVKRAPAQLNGARLTALSGAYTEVLRQLEIAKITLQKETPLYQVIDEPIRPLPKSMPDIKGSMLWNAIYGLVIAFIALTIKRFWSDIKMQFNG